ncbi:hypothetical protein [uncultured Desulfuromusa sp.]|uniref:hypothetical protein n=1 Tax=uncultured Desulfuromusa sp. TaxID=219183 RepID=UPI002AA8FC8B|nr:hypothetical protein [uncultured Desulfuromusa sp.]
MEISNDKYRVKINFLFMFFLSIILGLLNVQCLLAEETGLNKNWKSLADKKVFFGHQSVGENILDGINDVTSGTLQVSHFKEGVFDNVGSFSHARVGENFDPISKIDAFYENISKANVKPDIAFLKLCYVDINKDTDIENIFEYYQSVMLKINADFPDIKLIHLTAPLKVNKTSWKTTVKKMLGRDLWEYADNVARNRYNKMVLDAFGGTGLVFDIASAEATQTDGSINSFDYKGDTYLAMIDDYSDDGGHLNEKGRRHVAIKLLNFLVEN